MHIFCVVKWWDSSVFYQTFLVYISGVYSIVYTPMRVSGFRELSEFPLEIIIEPYYKLTSLRAPAPG
jgi:hypothetical protein